MARRPVIVAGFGFRVRATQESLADALGRASAGRRVGGIATAAAKADHPALLSLAAHLNLEVEGVGAAVLGAQVTATVSAPSMAAHGAGSVAEAAALAIAGPGARLLAPRTISEDRLASCALAARET